MREGHSVLKRSSLSSCPIWAKTLMAEGNYKVQILVEDVFEGMCPGIARQEAESMASDIRKEHLVDASVILCEEVKDEQ